MMIEFCGNCKVRCRDQGHISSSVSYYKKAPGKTCKPRATPIQAHDGRMVYIASAMRGDIEGNLKKAAAYCQAAADRVIPIAPHLYFSSYLDDRIPEERAGMEWDWNLEEMRRALGIWCTNRRYEGGNQLART